jgi:hypothetical protein
MFNAKPPRASLADSASLTDPRLHMIHSVQVVSWIELSSSDLEAESYERASIPFSLQVNIVRWHNRFCVASNIYSYLW